MDISIHEKIKEELLRAAEIIKQGGVVALPTETYYGLAVDPFNEEALDRLFRLKNRPAVKPILTLVESVSQLSELSDSVPDVYKPLMERFWPGPLTLILDAKKNLPERLTGFTGTVGTRISSHPVVHDLLKLTQIPVTATSANIAGMPPAQTASDVRKYFSSKLDLVIDINSTPGGLCSTVVKWTGSGLDIVREGAIASADIFPTG